MESLEQNTAWLRHFCFPLLTPTCLSSIVPRGLFSWEKKRAGLGRVEGVYMRRDRLRKVEKKGGAREGGGAGKGGGAGNGGGAGESGEAEEGGGAGDRGGLERAVTVLAALTTPWFCL